MNNLHDSLILNHLARSSTYARKTNSEGKLAFNGRYN